MQERLRACHQREGHSYVQNCDKELKQFNEVSKAFNSRCKYFIPFDCFYIRTVSHAVCVRDVGPTVHLGLNLFVLFCFDVADADLGAHGNSRRCLMKQKQRMLEQKA